VVQSNLIPLFQGRKREEFARKVPKRVFKFRPSVWPRVTIRKRAQGIFMKFDIGEFC
jgi:hypothetical protein